MVKSKTAANIGAQFARASRARAACVADFAAVPGLFPRPAAGTRAGDRV